MNKNISIIIISLLVCGTASCASTEDSAPAPVAAATPAPVPAPEAALDRPSFSASQTMTASALVEAIDQESRLVTLRTADDEEITFTAGEDVRNLGQVSVGDILTIEIVESVSIEVMANDGMEATEGEASAIARAEEGDMPGMAAMEATVITATVEEINLDNNTFKLKTADGEINEFVAQNPDNLRRSQVGDLVVASYSTAIAIVVEKHEAE